MKRLEVKDFILTGAFAALYFICVGLGTLVGTLFDKTGSMLYAPAFSAVFGGTVYMILASKIRKFGAITILGLVMAGFFFFSGHFWMSLLPGIFFGILADSLAFLGRYQNRFFNLLSFAVFSFVNSGPILLMWFARDLYVDNLLARGKSMTYIERVLLPANFETISWFIFTVILGALIGGIVGQYLLKKHFVKAGMVV